jgi:hypothetical protein
MRPRSSCTALERTDLLAGARSCRSRIRWGIAVAVSLLCSAPHGQAAEAQPVQAQPVQAQPVQVQPVHVQPGVGRGPVHGVAFDSLRRVPLVGALVSLVGGSRTTTSDASGRFRFDSVSPGTYTATLMHEALDSLGLSGVTARVVVTGARDSVQLGVPSFSTLWRTACGSSAAPMDSGFVFGTVRSADREQPITDARVAMSYVTLRYDAVAGMVQKRVRGEVRTDGEGSYALCGVPLDVPMRLMISKDSLGTSSIEYMAREQRVRRKDFSVRLTPITGRRPGAP